MWVDNSMTSWRVHRHFASLFPTPRPCSDLNWARRSVLRVRSLRPETESLKATELSVSSGVVAARYSPGSQRF